MPVISIIIPVYNSGLFLTRCTRSILNQDIDDIELILVNDGSTDNSLSICNYLAQQDSRIKVITQKNTGVSGARNAGLMHASGQYIHFVDSDDYLTEGFYADAFREVISKNFDLYCCTYFKEDYKGVFLPPDSSIPNSLWNKTEAIRQLLLCKNLSYSLCDKIIKRSIISDLQFNTKIHHNEDFLFCYELLKRADTIFFTPKPFYYYCFNSGSSVNIKFNKKKFTAITAQKIVYDDIQNNFPQLKHIAKDQFYKVVLYLSEQMRRDNYSNPDDKKKINKIITSGMHEILTGKLALGYKLIALKHLLNPY